ncbi:bifunctional metallophosphatase/5'-nucleotidase [Paramicrobacterium agarici]|uniref:bifunctional metallophosphatase/5'-nucleotidase n=1 Tax=Paramicrobacterium agarici TaxID=630514 RepID=UPI00114EF6F0|nr:5'-nucleotidase C-terminal domain-containing protein [Microbacterium agarici]TQO23504.1 2',3'-cyclic-nucleotide 2'-phosphodiesterase (5'-nucleotidase family) [Microbacterium agarici]
MLSHTRRTRRLTAIGALAGLALAPLTAISASAAEDGPTTINLININDFHGRIDDNTVSFAGTIEKLRAEAVNPIFLSAGDNIGASVYASSVQNDEPTIDVLNDLDLAASAVGNHEFDKGIDDLAGWISDRAEFPYLGANVYDDAGEPVLDEYALVPIEGTDVTVGVIGAVTQEVPSLVSKSGIEGLTFGDPVDAVNRVAGELTDGDESNGEADVIVAEYHEGASDGASLDAQLKAGGAFAKIVTETSAEVDAIFTGHTHKQYAWEYEGRAIVQTGSYGENIGQITLSVAADGTVNTEAFGNTARLSAGEDPTDEQKQAHDQDLIDTYPRVAAVNDTTQAALAFAKEEGSKVLGTATADITTAYYVNDEGETVRDDRSSESTLGNFVADAMLETLSDESLGGAEIGVVNPGGLRAELFKGEITVAEANSVLPFLNNLWTTTLTGEQVKIMLEQQWQRAASPDAEQPSRPYLQLGLSNNVTYTYDPDAEMDNHITSVTVNGEPLDMDREYRIGSFSFLLDGGDNFHVFTEGTNTKDSGLIDRDAWMEYIKTNSPVSPSYDRRAVAVEGFPTEPVEAGTSFELGLSKLNLTSLNVPQETGLTIALDGEQIGTAEVVDGAANARITIPADVEGDHTLTLTGDENGTVVTFPVTVVPGDGGTDEPGTEKPSEEPAPVDDSDIPDAAEGGISTVDEAQAGDTITIDVGADRAGEWVSVWLYSEPIQLSDGWVQVSADGTVEVTIPSDVPAGEHRIVVLDASGDVIGWQDITIAAAEGAGGGTTASGDLPRTGAEASELLPFALIALGLMALGGAAFGVSRYRARKVGDRS